MTSTPTSDVPMVRLYRFLNAEFGLRSLVDKRLRVGRIEELNDDFEFIGVATDIREERIALRNTRRQLSANNGVLCMSKGWESPLMWAHYGDSHKGMALGFDVPADLYPAVEYVEKRPSRQEMGLGDVGRMSEATMERLIKMKAKGWAYEQEHRAFVGLNDGILLEGTKHFFVDFGPQLILKEVIVGSRFRTQRSEVMRLVDSSVDVFMTRGDFEDFKVVRQQMESMWP